MHIWEKQSLSGYYIEGVLLRMSRSSGPSKVYKEGYKVTRLVTLNKSCKFSEPQLLFNSCYINELKTEYVKHFTNI